jgi:putative exporter of polyketide antibiotics
MMSQHDARGKTRKQPVEPLLPIEKKLIGWSLGIGIFLLIVLAVINRLLPATL